MGLRIVESEYRTSGNQLATVVVEADRHEELLNTNAKLKALEYARSKNFPAHGISNLPAPYPVGVGGQVTDGVLTGKEKIAAWRLDVDVSPGRSSW